jgi:hypothetical protein
MNAAGEVDETDQGRYVCRRMDCKTDNANQHGCVDGGA